MAEPLIVAIDSNPPFLRMLGHMLTEEGYSYHPVLAGQNQDLSVVVRDAKPDLLLVDTWLEGPRDGVEWLRRFAEDPRLAQVPVLVCSSDPGAFEEQTESLPLHQRVVLLGRPFSHDELLSSVHSLLR